MSRKNEVLNIAFGICCGEQVWGDNGVSSANARVDDWFWIWGGNFPTAMTKVWCRQMSWDEIRWMR